MNPNITNIFQNDYMYPLYAPVNVYPLPKAGQTGVKTRTSTKIHHVSFPG